MLAVRQFGEQWKTDLSPAQSTVKAARKGSTRKSRRVFTLSAAPLLSSCLRRRGAVALRLSVKCPTVQAPAVCYGSLAISEPKRPSSKTYGRQARHLKYCCVITRNLRISYRRILYYRNSLGKQPLTTVWMFGFFESFSKFDFNIFFLKKYWVCQLIPFHPLPLLLLEVISTKPSLSMWIKDF